MGASSFGVSGIEPAVVAMSQWHSYRAIDRAMYSKRYDRLKDQVRYRLQQNQYVKIGLNASDSLSFEKTTIRLLEGACKRLGFAAQTVLVELTCLVISIWD